MVYFFSRDPNSDLKPPIADPWLRTHLNVIIVVLLTKFL